MPKRNRLRKSPLIIPSKKTPLRMTPQIIVPSAGEKLIRCDRCGMMAFRAHVRLVSHGAAKLTNLECLTCKKLFQVDDRALMAGRSDPLPKGNGANGSAQPNHRRLT